MPASSGADGGGFAPALIRRAARENVPRSLVVLFFRQLWTELMLSRRRIRFRRAENDAALRAYRAMTAAEFSGVNARQEWSNWRTIPRNLRGRLPAGPCRALDLCSGLGHSTQVLAYYLPAASEILGLEDNPEFVAAAARRRYRRADGGPADVSFRSQSVLDTFRDVRGLALPESSVGLVNSCGALGIHFGPAEIARLADEIFRVLRSGGLATVDSGKEGVGPAEMIRIFESRGFRVLSRAKSCFLDRFTHIGFRKR